MAPNTQSDSETATAERANLKDEPEVAKAKGRKREQPGDGSASDDELRRYFDRLTNLMNEKNQLSKDIAELCNEIRDHGFHAQGLKAIVKEQLETDEEGSVRRSKEEAIADYKYRLGFSSTPLAQAAAKREAEQAET